MKISKYLIITIILLFIFSTTTHAYTCSYDIKEYHLFFGGLLDYPSFDAENNTINIKSFGYILDPYIDSNYTEANIVEYLNGKYDDYLYICKHQVSGSFFIIDGTTLRNAYSNIINTDLYNYFNNTIQIGNVFF